MELEKKGKVVYLQNLCKKYGDFKVSKSVKQADGSVTWSKHYSVLDLWHDKEGIEFLNRVNNRTSLECEIILDLDNNPTRKKVDLICDSLQENRIIFDCFFSGSKGYHIHVLVPLMCRNNKIEREEFRKFLITKYGADLAKKSESAMIALEYNLHYKTGNKKEFLRGFGWTLAVTNY